MPAAMTLASLAALAPPNATVKTVEGAVRIRHNGGRVVFRATADAWTYDHRDPEGNGDGGALDSTEQAGALIGSLGESLVEG
jgi:hypothetical protein